MNFKNLSKSRDIVDSSQKFEKWFKENKYKLIWNEEVQGYNSLGNINISLF